MTLQEIGIKHGTDKATCHKYCDFYENELQGLNPKRILEIGVKNGASLRMWKEYYPDAEVIGIDINEPIEVPGCKVLKMDAKDIWALKDLGIFDLIIDDGSHFCLDQQVSFNHLYYNQLLKGGCYIWEDLHSSYYSEYCNSKYTTHEIFNQLKLKKKEFKRLNDYSDSVTCIIWK